MATPEPRKDELHVALRERTAYIRVVERGCFKISSSLKEFGIAAIDQGINRFILDMSECVGMDSTFMGVVAGLSFRLRQQSGGEIHLIELSSRTKGLLATLGLDQIVRSYMAGSCPENLRMEFKEGSDLSNIGADDTSRQETAEMMLEAHENLVQLTPENLPRFKDVITFLREDIEKADSSDG